jgi:hypothetical protein
LLNDKQISSVLDSLISSLINTGIKGLINLKNKHINTFLLELVVDRGDYTP